MAFRINTVKADICSYPHTIIMGERKTGKTTMFRDLIIERYGSPEYGLLISCGAEKGYKALDNLQVEDAPCWTKEYGYEEEDLPQDLWTRGFVEIVDELVETAHKQNIKIVGIDTLDEWYNIATKRVFDEHKKKYGEYPDSLNSALGGFMRGRDRVIALLNGQLERLENAGYHPIIICHTKNKDKTDAKTGLKYERITNNLDDKTFESIAGTSQWVLNVVVDRDIKSSGKKDNFGNLMAGDLISSERMIYFRDDNPLIDAGGRFVGLPEKLPLSAKSFWDAFELGVKNSRTTKITNEEEKEQIKKEQEQQEMIAKKSQQLEQSQASERKDELVNTIKEKMGNIRDAKDSVKAQQVKELFAQYEVTLKELEKLSLKDLIELTSAIKKL